MTEEAVLDERRAFAESRQNGIGATDAAALLGLSKWKGRVELYHEKVDDVVLREPSLPAWMGLKVQHIVAELYEAETGRKLRADNGLHRLRGRDYVLAHLDYRIVGDRERGVEVKTAMRMTGWGEPGTEAIPIQYWCQVQHEMLVTGWQVVDVAVLFGHHTYRTYTVKRDEEFLSTYLAAVDEFWLQNVVPGIEPPLDGSKYSAKLVAERYPEDDGSLKPTTAEQRLIVNRLRAAYVQEQEAALALEAAKVAVKDIIGNADGIIGPFGKITWKRPKPSRRTGWQQVADSLRAMFLRAYSALGPDDQAWLAAEGYGVASAAALEDLYTTETASEPRFVMAWKEEE